MTPKERISNIEQAMSNNEVRQCKSFPSIFVIRYSLFIILLTSCLCVFVALSGCAGYSDESIYPRDVSTVCLKMFDNQSFRRGVEYELSDALAKRIVEFRVKHGPFRRLEDLLVIQGMSRKKFESLKPHLKLD